MRGFKYNIGGKPLVLIADASETFVMYISILLSRMSFDIIPAEDGVTALRLIKILEPDVIMLDADLPEIGGLSALRYLKVDERLSEIPIIMLSLRPDEAVQKECEELGCAGYLAKPVRIYELHETLQKCIVHPPHRRKYFRVPYENEVMISHKSETLNFYAINLSERGIFIRTQHPFPVGARVKIVVPLKGDRSASLRGEVIYTRGIFGDMFRIAPGMAIRFERVGRDTAALLKDYITDILIGDLMDEHGSSFIAKDDEQK